MSFMWEVSLTIIARGVTPSSFMPDYFFMFDETNTTYETRYNLLAALTQEHFSDTLHTVD